MSSFDSKLYNFAVKEAKEAVAYDGKGQYRQAINKYQRAAESLIQFIKYNNNQIMIKKCKRQIEEYLDRAKLLKSHLSGSRPIKSSAKRDIKETGGEEEISDEEQEILDMISGTIITESPNVRWSDIAGLKSSKQVLREAIVLPILKPELFTGARKPWSGVLLFGPPGCGKTLLAKAAASECKATFFSASSADLLSKWLGESEKLVSALFRIGRLRAPSLIFIDEIDSLATKRGTGSESAN
jgi:vacuolar protein-sorting-associated protein 4